MKKTNKRWLALMAFALMCQMPALAQSLNLKVWKADGQVMTFNLGEEPRTTYCNGILTITTSRTTITYPLNQVRKYTYVVEDFAGEGDGVPDGINVALIDNGESLSFKGLKPGTEVQLLDASGKVLRNIRAAGDMLAVSASQLPVGFYFVKANGVTYKIMKR
jgi:hypothetical protein